MQVEKTLKEVVPEQFFVYELQIARQSPRIETDAEHIVGNAGNKIDREEERVR